MALGRLVATGFALWVAAQVVAGIRLQTGPDPLATIGTVLVLALLLGVVNTVTRGVRQLAGGVQPVPLAVAALILVNAALFWLTTALASAIGLGYAVDGFVAALVGSLVVLLVGWIGRLLITETR